ncbi:LuxR C-terminal-related transcriptional regulator [Eggerthella sinensis]|uniref:LuxR C-terminal-related transcriptional regulator n=1 Tax=Eggerthella sinensis TaxID=242230 RepID=UPI001D08B4EA|nr:LuxR C-terminal-related transcriptional regulator [Eggerthella sinensis]MCB7038947.1 LuxR C-terminal-related transcriptional regulator [Eggerthella sinensis]
MMKERGNLFYGATSASSIAGSALMWAWWDLAFYSGIFFNWNQSAQAFTVPSLAVGMAASGVTLFLLARFAPAVSAKLYGGTGRLIGVGIAGIASSLLSIAAASWSMLPLALASSAVNGAVLALVMALWGTVWTERGAQSATVNASLAITIGIVFDGIVLFAMKPLAAAVAISTFPLLSILMYVYAARDRVDGEVFSRTRSTRRGHARTSNVLKREFFGISVLLLLGLTIGEIAFNFMNYHFAYEQIASTSGMDFNYPYHVARAIGACTCFVAIGVFNVSYKRFFWVGTLLMSFAFAMMPFLGALGIPPYYSNYVNMACFALVAIFELSVFCEISYARHTYPLESVCFGMIFMTGIIDAGLLVGVLVDLFHLDLAQYAILMTAVGYVLVFGLLAAISEGQRYLDPDTGVASGRRLQTEVQNSLETRRRKLHDALVKQAKLTVREQDILDELLRGRSTVSIAGSFNISDNTVKSHVQSIYKKLGIHSKQEMLERFDLPPENENPEAQEPGPDDSRKRALDATIAHLARAHGLTARESEVFGLMARGYRPKEMEERLFISSATVHSHTTNIYAKMDLHSYDDLSALVKRTRSDMNKADDPAQN